MRLRRLVEPVTLADLDLDGAHRDHVEDCAGGRLEILAGGDVGRQGRPREVERAPVLQVRRHDRGHRAARRPEGYEVAARGEAVQGLLERSGAA